MNHPPEFGMFLVPHAIPQPPTNRPGKTSAPPSHPFQGFGSSWRKRNPRKSQQALPRPDVFHYRINAVDLDDLCAQPFTSVLQTRTRFLCTIAEYPAGSCAHKTKRMWQFAGRHQVSSGLSTYRDRKLDGQHNMASRNRCYFKIVHRKRCVA